MRKLESLGQYHDLLIATFLSAPDHFSQTRKVPVDQRTYFLEAFDDLRSGFHFVQSKTKDPRLSGILREMIEMAFEAYEAGDKKLGAHTLQEFGGLIWKSMFIRIKHAVEAERRAFGSVELYKDVRITPYPYEGSASDLRWDQRRLLAVAEQQSREFLRQGREFKPFCWVCNNQGSIFRMTAEPRSDLHEVLRPLQKSWKGTLSRLKELANAKEIRASVIAQYIGLLTNPHSGSFHYRLEERGAPYIAAIQRFKPTGGGLFEFSSMRFHLNDALIFSEEQETTHS